jgi:hypothetical protein
MTSRTVDLWRISKTTVGLTVALAFLCLAMGRGDATSALAGGAFSIANLHLIRVLVSRLLAPGADGRRTATLLGTKFLLLLALLAIALKRLPIDAGSFGIGAGMLLVAIVLDAVLLGTPVPPIGDDEGRS